MDASPRFLRAAQVLAKSPRDFTRSPRGFTLVELVIVIVLIGILAVTAMARLDSGGFSSYAYAESVKVAVRSAHRLATARNEPIRVVFSANGFVVQRHADGTFVINPSTGQPWDGTTSERGAAPTGTTLSTGSGPTNIYFDGLGRVFQTADNQPLTSALLVTVTANAQSTSAVTIEVSGHVR